MNFTSDCKQQENAETPKQIETIASNNQNKYDPIKKKAPLIKSKNTRYEYKSR